MIKIQPIYQEYINFLKDHNINLDWLEEGYYWLDNGIVKGFEQDGTLKKIASIKTSINQDKNSKYHYKLTLKYNNPINNPMSWEQTVNKFNNQLENKVEQAKCMTQISIQKFKDYTPYILTSTGKDSQVMADIVNKLINCKTVFNNTSLDCADTYKIVNQHSEWVVTNPKQGFYDWIKEQNMIPTRFSRACCSIFKEGNHIETFQNQQKLLWFMGIRNDESNNRSKYKWISKNPKWEEKKLDWISISPIIHFTEFDIWLYILKNNLKINPKYKKGYKRCGCAIACPYATKSTWALDEYWYPKMRKRWVNILQQDFKLNEKWYKLNCTIEEYIDNWNGGLVRESPTTEVINEFKNYSGLDKNIIMQYFNKSCYKCKKNIRQKDILGMNMKYFGRNTNKFLCKKCLKKEFNWTNEDFNNQIKTFLAQGCELF